MTSIADLIRCYGAEHEFELSENYLEQLRAALRSLEAFIGGEATLAHLDREILNAWLRWLADAGRSPRTRKNYRTSILTIAQYAAEEGMIAAAPAVRRVRQPRRIVEAWTPEEVARLAEVAGRLPGRFSTGVARGVWLQSLVLGLWDSGLRLGDALDLVRAGVRSDGTFTVLQSKTGREIVRQFSVGTMSLIDASGARNRHLIWPLWGRREAFYRLFRQTVSTAGIRPGTTRWIRRAGVTAIAVRDGIEAAQRFADHRSASTTWQHYVDPCQLARPTMPPRI